MKISNLPFVYNRKPHEADKTSQWIQKDLDVFEENLAGQRAGNARYRPAGIGGEVPARN